MVKQRDNRSLHVAQGPPQNFVPKPTYWLELNLLIFKNTTKIILQRSVLCQCACNMLISFVRTNKSIARSLAQYSLASRLYFCDGALPATY